MKIWSQNINQHRNYQHRKKLKFETVLSNAVPSTYSTRVRRLMKQPYPELDLSTYKPTSLVQKKLSNYFLNQNTQEMSHQKAAAISKKLEDVFYVKGTTRRMITNKHSKSYKHAKQNDFIRRTIEERWKAGLAVSKSELLRLTIQEFKNDVEWMKIYGNQDGNKKINIFLDRGIAMPVGSSPFHKKFQRTGGS